MSIGLADYEMEFRGLRFGGTDGSNPVGIRMIDGLQDFDARVGNTPIPRGDGSIPGLHTVKEKDIKLDLIVNGASKSQAIEDAMAEARAVFQRDQTPEPLYFKFPGQAESFVYARAIGRQERKGIETAFGQRPLLVRMLAADPRVYGSTQKSATLGVYDGTGGGEDFPIPEYGANFNLDTSAEAVVTNAGDANAYPLLRFYYGSAGTITAVKVTNTTTGQVTEFTTTITTGQVLTADMRRIVTADTGDSPYIDLNGSSRYGDWVLPREPFYLVPGDNSLRFELTGTSTDAQCVVTFRDTSL